MVDFIPKIVPWQSKVRFLVYPLYLEDHEKFRDAQGNVLDIEVRGERDHKSCYFLMKDVSKVFNIARLYETLTNRTSTYDEKLHYIYFNRSNPNNIGVHSNEKLIYLTYTGILKVLFSSRTGRAENFQEWATEKLFTIQMGTTDDKEFLASKLLGVSVETVWKFLSACVRDIPMVYMLYLGTVPDSIEVEGNRNDYLLFKIGQHGKEDTKCGFQGRSKGHTQEFKEFRHEMSYFHFVFLDPMYVSESEKCIKDFFSQFRINYQDKKEVYLIPRLKLDDIKEFFKHLSVIYSGNHADIQRTWDQFKNDTRTRMHDMEVENQHLREIIEQKEHHYDTLTTKTQIIIDNLQDRVIEQASTIRAFIARMIPSNT